MKFAFEFVGAVKQVCLPSVDGHHPIIEDLGRTKGRRKNLSFPA